MTLDLVDPPGFLGVESEMRSIGELARASGLSVSALRFYDGANVLVPAVVDPVTGYRWYAPDQLGPARLLAGLRRVGMPLAEIRLVLAGRGDPVAVRRLLDAHLRRLEDGLADARRELSRVHALLDREENIVLTSCTIRAADLASALDAVRFAVGTDPELPVLGGVLFELTATGLRLVASDRHRLAVATAPLRDAAGPPVRLVVPTALVDDARALLPADAADVAVRLGPASVQIEVSGRHLTGTPVPGDFPDVDRLLHRSDEPGLRPVPVDVPTLRRDLAPGVGPEVIREHDGVPRDVAVLRLDASGGLAVAGEEAVTSGDTYVGVDREFLLEALDAGGQGQLVLELDGPIRPLAIRVPGDDQRFSILMPFRLV